MRGPFAAHVCRADARHWISKGKQLILERKEIIGPLGLEVNIPTVFAF